MKVWLMFAKCEKRLCLTGVIITHYCETVVLLNCFGHGFELMDGWMDEIVYYRCNNYVAKEV